MSDVESVQIASEEITPKPRSQSEELIEKYKNDNRAKNLSEETSRRYISSLKIFSDYLDREGVELLEVDHEILENFIIYLNEDRSISYNTLKNYFSALSSLYSFLEYKEYVEKNHVPVVRERYVRRYKNNDDGEARKLISVEEMANLVNAAMDIRDKALIILLAKTGIRRSELQRLDVTDINWKEQSIRLKPTPKRKNRTVFFDDETTILLNRWLKARETRNRKDCKALFINTHGNRIGKNEVYLAVSQPAKLLGLYDPSSDRLEDHFGPHCCRHWFTTHMRRAGMPREFIQEIRGDVRKDAIDIYDHIDKKELKEKYLECIPKLGI